MSSLNSDNFKIYFYKRFELNNGWQSFYPVAKYLNTLKANRRFFLLSSVVGDKQHKLYGYQRVASGLMIKLDAGCPIPVRDSVWLVLDTLNPSVREYPFFLAYKFGKKALLSELAQIKQDASLSQEQKQGLETLEYWTTGYSLERYRQLKQSWSDRIKG